MKDPDNFKDKYYVVYGEVYQFDAATGNSNFLANSGSQKDSMEYGFTEYAQNTSYVGDPALFSDVLEGDVFKATVRVLGTDSYDTQEGGHTIVPKLEAVTIEVYGSTL